MKTGIELIAEERKEQIEKHGRTVEKDVQINHARQLTEAAKALLMYPDYEYFLRSNEFPPEWNIEVCYYMAEKPYKERLIIAGALIAAEIDRLNLLTQTPEGK